MILRTLFVIMLCTATMLTSRAQQKIPYGNNPAAGHYMLVGDAKLYYEVYGQGEPLVMLHGGVYGYIDEFASLIPLLAERYQVICIATRGHGKSFMGNSPYTYEQRAKDVFQVVRSITQDSVIVLGFSDGGMSALKLAATYPQLVKRLVAIGVNDVPKGSAKDRYHYSRASLMKEDSAFFTRRLQLMPEPDRWDESLAKLNKLYNEDFMSTETFSKIVCPTLVMSGDHDDYATRESVVRCAAAIKGSQLSFIPGCGHVVFFCNFPAVWESMKPFLNMAFKQ
ncbi:MULTISPECIES: alpha/beta fold hydrolase [Chitinophagaceae]